MREMKDSGVPWIGEIPKEWTVHRIKTLFSERVELSDSGAETLMSVSEYYGVDSRSAHLDTDEYLSRSESLVGYKKCFPGDLVSNIMLAWKGSLGIAAQAGIVSPAYCVYKPSNNIFPMYYHYLFRTGLYTWQFKCYSKGIIDSRLRLYSPFFYDIPAIIPPLAEQRRIADFLDAKCTEIDSVLEKTKASIEEYRKLKQSVITEAVTKGVRGKRPMKDSGVEWIGEIPEEWTVLKGKYIFRERSEKGNSLSQELLSPTQKFGVIPQSLYEKLTGAKAVKLDESTDFTKLKTIHKNDYCISLRSFQGGFEFCEYEGLVSPAYHVFYSTKDCCHGYFKRLFKERSFIDKMCSYTLTLRDGKNISFEDFGDSLIPVPPLTEQQEIATYLDSKCATIESLISSKEALVAELETYKKSLIYEFVTGKKEVPTV